MKKFVCPVCGYVHSGDEAPAACPLCGVPGAKFTEMAEDAALAAEHEFGIYSKTVENNDDISADDKAYILEQLKANFNGECSEVGMYLCMARIAKAIPRSACIGRKRRMKRQSMRRNLPSCSARRWSPT